MPADLSILYRGPLSSCNYDCAYCPFAKRHDSPVQLREDRESLKRFVQWASQSTHRSLAVLFTPWGEALTRPWYQEAFQRLTNLPHVQKVAAQTNLSWKLDWLDDCRSDRVGLWCTYHPSEVAREGFLSQSAQLTKRGVDHSVGMVALPQELEEIEIMRKELPAEVYLWINAWEDGDRKYSYSQSQRDRLLAVDPLFENNATEYASMGRDCRTGTSVISVDGEGNARRCHFVSEDMGSLYDEDFDARLNSSPCPNQTCSCHIGYVHMPELKLYDIFGEGVLERVPARHAGFS